MKNFVKIFGTQSLWLCVVVLAAVMGFAASCGGGGSSNSGSGGGPVINNPDGPDTGDPEGGIKVKTYDDYPAALYLGDPLDGGVPKDIEGETGDTVIEKAVAYIKNNAAPGRAYFLLLDEDVEVTGWTVIYLNVSNFNLTLIGIGGERVITRENGGPYFVGVGGGGLVDIVLTLDDNITFKGFAALGSNLFQVEEGGTLIMNGASKITGNNKGGGGGAVFISKGTFIMNSGTISDNTSTSSGGGVLLTSGSSFTMNGGTISGNSSGDYGGGVFVASGGSFIKTGGTIYGNVGSPNGNYAGSSGHAVYVDGSPIKYMDSTVGPEITLNSDELDNWE